jgi:ankyrin repeat protein
MLQSCDTPLHLASSNGHLEVVRYLIEECGTDVNAKNAVSEFD